MPHKILVTVSVIHEGVGADYLQSYELIRGELSKVSVAVTNLSDDFFPGGSIKNIEFRWGEQARTKMYNEFQIDSLEQNSEANLVPSLDVIALTEGIAWLQLEIEATDGQPVECFQEVGGQSVGNNNWQGAFYAVNREHLHIINLLNGFLSPKEE